MVQQSQVALQFPPRVTQPAQKCQVHIFTKTCCTEFAGHYAAPLPATRSSISLRSWRKRSARKNARPAPTVTTGSGIRASVHSTGNVRSRPVASRYDTRSPPQLLRTARTSKACPFNGWNGCVTVKTCSPPSSRSAMRAFRQVVYGAAHHRCRSHQRNRPTYRHVYRRGNRGCTQ